MSPDTYLRFTKVVVETFNDLPYLETIIDLSYPLTGRNEIIQFRSDIFDAMLSNFEDSGYELSELEHSDKIDYREIVALKSIVGAASYFEFKKGQAHRTALPWDRLDRVQLARLNYWLIAAAERGTLITAPMKRVIHFLHSQPEGDRWDVKLIQSRLLRHHQVGAVERCLNRTSLQIKKNVLWLETPAGECPEIIVRALEGKTVDSAALASALKTLRRQIAKS